MHQSEPQDQQICYQIRVCGCWLTRGRVQLTVLSCLPQQSTRRAHVYSWSPAGMAQLRSRLLPVGFPVLLDPSWRPESDGRGWLWKGHPNSRCGWSETMWRCYQRHMETHGNTMFDGKKPISIYWQDAKHKEKNRGLGFVWPHRSHMAACFLDTKGGVSGWVVGKVGCRLKSGGEIRTLSDWKHRSEVWDWIWRPQPCSCSSKMDMFKGSDCWIDPISRPIPCFDHTKQCYWWSW